MPKTAIETVRDRLIDIERLRPGEKRQRYKVDGGGSLWLYVYPTGAKVWYARTTIAGRPGATEVRIGEFPSVTVAGAKSKAAEIYSRAAIQGVDVVKERAQQRRAAARDSADLLGFWLDQYVSIYGGRVRAGEYGAGTLKRDKSVIEKHIRPALAGRVISEMKPFELEKLRTDIAEACGRGAAANFAKLLKKIINFAMESDGSITINPARKLDARSGVRTNVATFEQLRQLWPLLCADDAGSGATRGALKLALLTAKRKSEVRQLKRDDWDAVSGLWTLRRSETKSGKRADAAPRADHVLPVGSVAAGIINEAFAAHSAVYAFPGPGGQMLSENALSRWLLRMRQRHGVGDVTPHDLRRTVASSLVDDGVEVALVETLLDHGPKSTAQKHYIKSNDAVRLRGLLDRWESILTREGVI